jgi:polysaccharide biosynthesis/export protein
MFESKWLGFFEIADAFFAHNPLISASCAEDDGAPIILSLTGCLSRPAFRAILQPCAPLWNNAALADPATPCHESSFHGAGKRLFTGAPLRQDALRNSGEESMKIKSLVHHIAQLPFASMVLAVVLLTGCNTTKPHPSDYSSLPSKESKDIALREADVLRIAFPGTANLDTVQTIRRDGKITLPMVGEVVASGKTPAELEKELIGAYASQLVSSKEITVTVVSASFPVFVTGAVQKPGKVLSDHPITVLEAIMECGGFDYTKANLKAVRIIRNQDKQTKYYRVNLKGVLNGTPIDIFYLQPSDIVYVPERFNWF